MREPKITRPGLRSAAPTWVPPSRPSAATIPTCVTQQPRRASRSINSTPPGARSGPRQSRHAANPLRRQIFARLEEFDFRPSLLGQSQIDACGREVHQFTGVIDGEIVMGLFAKLSQPLLVAEAHPPGYRYVDRLEHALHAVFVLQAKCNHFELQLADGAENQIIVAQRLEQLRRALLAELRQAFLQGLHAQWILQDRAPKHF